MSSKLITLGQLRAMATEAQNAVGRVALAAAEAIDEVSQKKADVAEYVDFVLLPDGWIASDAISGYPYRYSYACAVTAAMRVQVILSAGSQSVAATCCLCPTVETEAGKIHFYAQAIPAEEISGEIILQS